MSEVAGRLAVVEGASYLSAYKSGRGVLILGAPGTDSLDVVIIGGAVVGMNCAKISGRMGARLMTFDCSLTRLTYLDNMFGNPVITRYSTSETPRNSLERVVVVVSTLLTPEQALLNCFSGTCWLI